MLGIVPEIKCIIGLDLTWKYDAANRATHGDKGTCVSLGVEECVMRLVSCFSRRILSATRVSPELS